MMEYLLPMAVGVLVIVLGILNMKENISLLHRYHRKRVSEEDRIPFGKKVGLGTIIVGITIILSACLQYAGAKTGNAVFQTIQTVVLITGFIIGFAIILLAMEKNQQGSLLRQVNDMKRMAAVFLAFLLVVLPLSGCTGQKGYKKEENTGFHKEEYPYLIKTPYAVWYLSKDDAGLLGEEKYEEGLYAVLNEAEADFADAREALKGFLPDKVEPIDIFTDFCGKAGIKTEKKAGAYYNGNGNFIKLFEGWDTACASLLHEYVHYLTLHCADRKVQHAFWAEGLAEYVSLFVCKNRMARSVNMGIDLSASDPEMVEQTWNEKENCLEPKLVYLGLAAAVTKGYAVGTVYFAVKNEWITRTEEIQNDPRPEDLMFYEAAGMLAYLTDSFGKDTVFGHWDLDPDKMDTVYGKPFSELYKDWVKWNGEQCRLAGIVIP